MRAIKTTTISILAVGLLAGSAVAVTAQSEEGSHVVAQDGSGDFITITEAVAIAGDGDTILVRPGTYDESVVIDKAITLAGDGPREDIVISFEDGQTPLLSIVDTDADVSNLTLSGEQSHVRVEGGAPTLHDLVFDDVGVPFEGIDGPDVGLKVSLYLRNTSAQIIGNTFIDGGELGVHMGSTPLIEGNTFTDGPHIYLDSAGDETVIRNNTISGTKWNGMGLFSPGEYVIEGNTIIDAPTFGIVGPAANTALKPIIRDNTISGSETAISMPYGASPTITGNELTGNDIAIQVSLSDGLIEDNRIRDGELGIVIVGGGSPTVMGNDIEVTGRGIGIGPETGGVISGNTVCGGEVSIFVDEDAEASVTDNETC